MAPTCDIGGQTMNDVRQKLRDRREVLDHVLTLLRRGHMTKANAVEAMNRACG
jgi:hypothetical protein